MEKKKDKYGNVKKVVVNGRLRLVYVDAKRTEYIRHNNQYVKLSKIKKKSIKKSSSGSSGGSMSDLINLSDVWKDPYRQPKPYNGDLVYDDRFMMFEQ